MGNNNGQVADTNEDKRESIASQENVQSSLQSTDDTALVIPQEGLHQQTYSASEAQTVDDNHANGVIPLNSPNNPIPDTNRQELIQGNSRDLQIESPLALAPENSDQILVENAERVADPGTQPGTSAQPNLKSKKVGAYSLCCLIKSRTREHADQKECKRSIWFEGKPDGVLKIGSDKNSGLVLKDDRCEKTHAMIKCRITQLDGVNTSELVLYPCARMYRQIPPFSNQKLNVGSVIKLGSISLEVINMNVSDGSDFNSNKSYLQPYLLNVYQKKDDGRAFEVDLRKSPSLVKQKTEESQDQDEEDTSEKEEVEVQREDLKNVMCYICWSGVDLSQHKIINESENEVIDFSSSMSVLCSEVQGISISSHPFSQANRKKENIPIEEETAPEPPLVQDVRETSTSVGEENDFNPMIRNPCGTCSGCSQFIHYKCLMRWIKTSKSGHCSICNGVLPAEFSLKPPNLELKIIRHRRGQRWVGTRRFRLSFAENSRKVLGSSYRSDVPLHDLSVSDRHAVIKFERDTKEFFISDNHSKGGTYVQLQEPLVLNERLASYSLDRDARTSSFSVVPPGVGLNEFKIGRTTLSVKVVLSKDKRSVLSKMLQRNGWRRDSTPAS